MKILCVDDSVVIREKLQGVLSEGGYNVTTASDGMKCLEILQSDAADFNLLVLDIDMPNMSGLQVCRMLREDARYADFPIIMLTGRDRKKDAYWGKEAGATAYMTKPFNDEELLSLIKEVLAGRSETSPDERMSPMVPVDQDMDVLFKAGELQEVQLFKMSLINKIYQISMSQFDLKETCSRIADLYSYVIEFDMATFLIADEERIKMFVFIKGPFSRGLFTEAKKRTKENFEEFMKGSALDWDTIELELSDPEQRMMKQCQAEMLTGFKTFPLESAGERFGMLTLARGNGGEFSREESQTCETINSQSAMVINNNRMYEKIKRFAVADGLTGLYNHRYFQEQLEKEYSRARRFNLSLSMIMLDLDHFKMINDTYGHQQGDVILKGVSAAIKRCVRDIDLLARYGGEEFSILLPETPKKNAMVVAERIREAISSTEFYVDGKKLEVRASLGVSGHPDDDIKTKLDLVAKADEALYKAKREGRDRVCLYAPERRTR